ncbi:MULTISPECIES: MFS transporter [unclassified Streptomyces]|uniref:MFS transporter n=1 Tax=unclassified Streptomyces TaxID=2593676 RepID=UPI00278C13FB|nr:MULTISPECIES: MFS transporter [unclassified Streptomyces]
MGSTPHGTNTDTPRTEPASTVPPPTRKAPPRLLAFLATAQAGLYFALLTPVYVSLTLKLQTLTADGDAVTALATVSSLGAAGAFLANPIFGRISDMTTGRFGRRRPWLVAGSTGLTLCLLGIALAPNVATVAVAWLIGQVCANAALAAYLASVADQVPTWQRGKVSGLVGLMQNLGVLGAAYVGKLLATDMLVLFMVPGLVGLAAMVLYAVMLPDVPLRTRPPRDGGWRTAVKTFWVSPRQHPDFAWAFVSRFMILLASFMFTTFRLMYLEHQLDLSVSEATGAMATGILVYTVAVMVTSQTAGWLSDKTGRRKVFVGTATLLFGIGTYMLVHVDSVGAFYWAELVLGLGYGMYIGVDIALVMDVLPDPDNAAKDLGVFNVANAAPQALAPGLAGFLVATVGGDSYATMLHVAAAICVVGALVVIPIKKVR